MKRYKKYSFSVYWVLLISLALFGRESIAASGNTLTEGTEEIRLKVEQNVSEVLELFNQEKQFYDTDPERFYGSMDAALNKIVDFRRIAARVMGKYARGASKAQKNRFVSVFKDSLYNTYTKTLVESGVFNIKVTKAQLNSRSNKKAMVDLQVITENGSVFPVAYSMYENKQGEWLLENVIVFGVNVGLAFRDRFALQYRKNKGNLDLVIDGWKVDLEIKEPQGAIPVAAKTQVSEGA